MSATYDPTLSTTKDWVRFLIGDDVVESAKLQDEEIAAILTEEGDKYLAAAAALSAVQSKLAAKGAGMLEKQVSLLRIRWGMEGGATDVIRARIDWLRMKGAQAVGRDNPFHFRALVIMFFLSVASVCSFSHAESPGSTPLRLEEPLVTRGESQDGEGSPFFASAWCVVGEHEGSPGCDAGVGVSLFSWSRLHWVAAVGLKTLGTGVAWVARQTEASKVTIAVAAGVVARYDEGGVGEELYPVVGATFGFGGAR